MFFKKKFGPVQWIVAGLGNPGKKYEGTRHNVGFEALDHMADAFSVSVRRSRFDALCGEGEVQGHKVLFVKPQTFMNLSGGSLLKAADYYNLTATNIIVLYDDVALSPGILRIRTKGSAGGHNGLKSIITFLGEDFPRVRLGVGDKPHEDYDMAKWVLSRMSATEQSAVYHRYDDVKNAVLLLMEGEPEKAMALYNGEGRPKQ